MDKSGNLIQLQRLKQLEQRFNLTRATVDKNELSDVFVCSTRNVTKIMNNLTSLGWIAWSPGKGRGNKSTLLILRSFQDLLTEQLKIMIQNGGLNEAFNYANIFHYQHIFKQKLPEWLTIYSDDLERSDELIGLVGYALPPCHPMTMTELQSGIYVNALFDTLIRFDSVTDTFTPHLAHQFYQSNNTYFFRIRPDVYFHNGELLTPEHVKSHMIKLTKHTPLFASVKSVSVNKRWLEVTLHHDDPIFLHALADIHCGVYLDNERDPEFPFGTGCYRWDTRLPEHWSLIKNEQYFGVHGILKRADFWVTDSDINDQLEQSNISVQTEVATSNNTSNNTSNKKGLQAHSQRITHYRLKGCQAVCIAHHVPDDVREQLASRLKRPSHQHGSTSQSTQRSCQTLFGDDLDKSAYLATCDQYLDEHPALEGETITYWNNGNSALPAVLESLITTGVVLKPSNELSNADVWLNDYLFGHDILLDQFYWLLAHKMTDHLLPPVLHKQWKDAIANASDLPQLFLGIEEICKQKHFIVPLWGKTVSFTTHESLRGQSTDSLGLMNLSHLWFDKRDHQR
ncbi:SgrR family transcriptional regulator [Vibrio methylphosphonaticus]|uniref:SgrR family transcriptional regulator n=1 Tax=Vibrio methylphosphonaticus TaxID=2946866 RepID=UPI00202A4695|nr:SgrR family transcriptional regulator [Vibrio methylphosphonaticus]MCL9776123.1 SgrR family transcriptional regulator [Vibrio methylphosphonaticus]